MRHFAAHEHQVAVSERLDTVAHPAQPQSTFDPGQLGVRVPVQAALEGREFKVEQAQGFVWVVHRFAEDLHGVEPIDGARRGKALVTPGTKTVILDRLAG